jgi:hypothetical protein
VKPWYTSKTVWFNILTVGGAAAAGLVGLVPTLQPFLTPESYAVTMVVIGLVNVVLRSITSDAIWYSNKDK